MAKERVGMKSLHRIKKTPIHTTVLDLLEELTALTKDDTLVMAAVKNIFATYNVRIVRTLAPVHLISRAMTHYRPRPVRAHSIQI